MSLSKISFSADVYDYFFPLILAAVLLWFSDTCLSLILYSAARSLMTSDAMINPATDGTNALEPGIARRSVHLCFAPGGQIQCARQLIDISSIGVTGCSLEYTTFSFFTPALFEFAAHDLRQRADRRLIDVRHLKHCRIQLVAGAHAADDRRSCLRACMTSAIFAVTVSTASTTYE